MLCPEIDEVADLIGPWTVPFSERVWPIHTLLVSLD
jgi:hypothetical protein